MNDKSNSESHFLFSLKICRPRKFKLTKLPVLISFFVVLAVLTGNVTGQSDASQPAKVASSVDDSSKVYSRDKLLKINIRMSPEDWAAIRIVHRTMATGNFADDPYTYAKADVEIDGVKIKSVGVRKKGFFGSVVSNKPSLKIRFDKFEKTQFFHGLDQLTLNNNVQDASQLHQYIAYWLFEKSGVKSPRCNFALVTVNGEKLGIYANVESIRDPFLERVFGDSDGRLYEGYAGDFRHNQFFQRIVSKNGKPTSGRKPLIRFRAVLADPKTELADIEKFLDLDEFISFWAAEVLMAHWDSYSGNRNNYYLYRSKDDGKFHFIPWGADSIFWDPGPFIKQSVPKSVKAVGAVCERLWKFPEVQKRYRSEMKRLLDDVWKEEALLAEMDRVQQMLKEHLNVDRSILNGKLIAAKTFVKGRRKDIQAELDRPAEKWPNPPRSTDAGPNPIPMEITGTFKTKLIDGFPRDMFKHGSGNLKVKIKDGEAKEPFAQVGTFALKELPGFIRPGYPCLYVIAQSEDKKKTWHFNFHIDPIRLAKEKPELPVDHFCVWATLTSGNPRSPDAEQRIFGVVGTLKLDQFENKTGSTVSGSFKLSTWAFKD